jgi:HEAT repeat protein
VTATSPSTLSDASEIREPPFAPALVEEMLRALMKGMRARQLYLPNNPMYHRSLEAVGAAFERLWKETEELTLTITETDIRWEGAVVSHEAAKSDGLAWLFYKDGVRELTMTAGFETRELVTLLDILQRVRKASPEEDDLLTLLWEQEFLHLRYRYVDLMPDGVTEPQAPDPNAEPRTIPPVQTVEDLQESKPQIVRMEDFDSTLYFLDEGEIEYLRNEVAQEYQSDLRRNVLAILFDIFEVEHDGKVRDEVCEVLESFTLHLLSAGAFGAVAYVLRESHTLTQRAKELSAAHREKLEHLPDRLSVPEVLAGLLQALDESEQVPAQEDLDALFDELREGALMTVLAWLGKLQHAELRDALEKAATRLAWANTAELIRLIQSPDPDISLEAIRRAGGLQTAASVPALGKTLSHASAAHRLAAVQAAEKITSPGALRVLEQAIEDSDRDVRLAAVRAIGSRRHRQALQRLETVVKGRTLRGADLTEKMAVFEVYGSLAGTAAVSYLDSILNMQSFLLRKREDPEIRACAAMALGKIASEDAIASLRKAQTDKDSLVRNAVNRAIRGGAA